MNKENKLCLITMLIGILLFIISFAIQNWIIKAILSIIGIIIIIISIIFEKKAKNPKNFGILNAIRSIIAKSKKR